MITKLYQLTFEQLSEIESHLVDVWLKEVTTVEQRKAIVSAVASCILVCDLVSIARQEQDKIAGGEGGDSMPRSGVNGCLSHKISPNVLSLKIPEKKSSISEVYEALGNISVKPDMGPNSMYTELGKRIHTMLYSLNEITLDEEQWADSYDLHINRRKSKNSVSTMPGNS